MTEEVLDGSCLCGGVTYQVRAPFLRFAHCHCSRCRKATGAAHASNLYVPPAHFTWTSGDDLRVRFDLPTAKSFATTFVAAAAAHSRITREAGREIVVPAGSLDSEPSLSPQTHIFWESRPGWSCGEATLPRAAEYTEDWRREPPTPSSG